MNHGHLYLIGSIDAVDCLRSLPNACADLIVTDPPYESLERHRAIGTTTRMKHSKASSNDRFRVFPSSRFRDLLSELYRVFGFIRMRSASRKVGADRDLAVHHCDWGFLHEIGTCSGPTSHSSDALCYRRREVDEERPG